MTKNTTTLRQLASLGLGALLLAGCAKEDAGLNAPTASRESADAQTATGSESVTRSGHQYIILATGDDLPANLAAQTRKSNGTVTAELAGTGLALATSADPDFAAKASKIAGVRSVIHDYSYQGFGPANTQEIQAVAEADNTNPPSSAANDRFFPLQWGHTAIEAPEAWNTGARGAGALVAVLDGGFDLTHPDLLANVVGSQSFVPGEAAQFVGSGFSHGTHTAGTIAAVDNSIGVIGVAPDAKLLLVKVLADAGRGSFSWLIQGIYYATSQQADVINMSLGAAISHNGKYRDDNGTPDDTSDDKWVNDTKEIQELLVAISKATSFATRNGVTMIGSAGNDANNGQRDGNLTHVPSGSTGVISISATGPLGWALNPLGADLNRIASYTNFGTSDVDFAAPGGDSAYPGTEIVTVAGVRQFAWVFDMVFSTTSRGRYSWSAGTSMAGPHAAGVAALIIGKNGGNMDPAQVRAAMRASADDLGKPGRDPFYGYGRVNALRAVTQ